MAIRQIPNSPTKVLIIVIQNTSMPLLKNLAISGVVATPTTKPPVTMVVATPKDSRGPGGGDAIREPRDCPESMWKAAIPTANKNRGKAILAVQLKNLKP